ncbi:MAG: DNA topoisomerase IB [Alphaproteobacteria bacterium]|nr:DNA topoisomerase IB [Alphaproteobacteria bacterium]
MPQDPHKAAHAAGLRHVSDEGLAGITRHGAPGRFHYRRPDGRPVRDRATLNRIKALVIPPAWKQVWIAPYPNAHLMATGRDARGRKQYRYHPGFAAVRDADKYAHLAHFAASLPAIRRRLKQDMARPGLPREKILATIVTLLEQTLIRIGNEDYARANHSFGLTTLRNRHVKVKGAELRFLFKGKSGKQWSLSVQDRRVARVIRSCQELPGQHLFEYRSDDGAVHAVSSTDVNEYLREIADADISAKDFRTWAGTVKAAMALRGVGMRGKKAVRAVVAAVAEELGNTVAVCRKCYIHPGIITAFEAGALKLRVPARGRGGLSAAEVAVLAYLRRRSARAAA